MKTIQPSDKTWETYLKKQKLPRKKKKSIKSYIRTNRVILTLDETPDLDLSGLMPTIRRASKVEHFAIDDFPTINIEGHKGKMVIGKPGKGKSIIGGIIEKYKRDGWDSLTESEKKIIEDINSKSAN